MINNSVTWLQSKRTWLGLASLVLLAFVCVDGLLHMKGAWGRDEYSHGYMIPFVALYLLWQKRADLMQRSTDRLAYMGVPLLICALCIWVLGEVSSVYTLVEYAFLLGLFAIALGWFGSAGLKVIWAPLLYLAFMIPLPNFFYFNLSQELQLVSSTLGVAVVRWFGVSVYLEGNVIDLGSYQLQVVEACNGLRYLFPLMSFGFLISYIYRGPVWQKILVFLSTIPITVLMNSFRIGVIGVTVEHFGIQAAEGFLHDFEGWVVFMACIGVLLLEIWLLCLFSGKDRPFFDNFDLDFGAKDTELAASYARDYFSRPLTKVMMLICLILVVVLPASVMLGERQNIAPARSEFSEFPLAKQGWRGREDVLGADVLGVLKVSDYFIGNYQQVGDGVPVNFYTAWYQEQRKGASIHSPKSCLPGGGWEIQRHTIEDVPAVMTSKGETLKVNRVVMQKGEVRQLVYYWFQGRNRNITNEYAAKWYIFVDSLSQNRTDGALVRLVTLVPEGSTVENAEQRLRSFLSTFYQDLPEYIPD